ncbi:hypothetical protein [Primorskyibacter sp. 2E233]|uniref:hypothetical protein n=1 Tax=Primorskyibacter sp. 2E233 TaxID=3413431 RepID=UPI003BF01859
MTQTLLVPMHLDALVLDAPEPVIGPALDIAVAPWFGDSGDGALRDHFSNVANVSSAMRQDPMSPSNRLLQPGTHLHWALPDALTHGNTRNPGHPAFVERDGLWFPKVPNRWAVLKLTGGSFDTLAAAWIVESDFVHPWGTGSEATSYPIKPGTGRVQPYVRLGRSYPVAGAVPPDKSDGLLADYDAGLTAVGYGDPTFAALYTGCHTVFGFHDPDLPLADTRYEVIGWYSADQDSPLGYWKRLDPQGLDRKQFIASLLASVDDPPKPMSQIQNWPKAEARAVEIAFANQTGWALSDPAQNFAQCDSLTFNASIQITAIKGSKPAPVDGPVTVGTSTSEAIAAFLSDGDTALEQSLEAISFHTEMKDHHLDYGAKLRETRHAAGFTATGKKTTWALRPPETAVSDPITGMMPRHDETQATLPEWLAQELNLLNIAQDDYDAARDTADGLRQQMYADWQLYMRACYPLDDRADFALDVDLLRDVVLVQSVDAYEAAAAELDPGRQGSVAARLAEAKIRILDAVNSFVAHAKHPQKLELVPVAGPRYFVPNDPIIATEAEALKQSPRHGQDGRARKDGRLECIAFSPATLPRADIGLGDLDALRQVIAAQRTPAFSEIAERVQGSFQSWNPIVLEWQASVQAYLPGSNLRSDKGRYDPGVIDNGFVLPEERCDLDLRQPTGPGDLATAYLVEGRSLLHAHGPQLLQTALDAYLKEKPALDGKTTKALAAVQTKLGKALDPKRQSQLASTSLGGFNQRLLMRLLEEQLPIADPLGFDADKARADQVRRHVGNANGYWSAETEAPFIPLRTARLALSEGRIIDSFGQFLPWYPGGRTGAQVLPAATLRQGTALDIYLPPRSAQPSRLDFRWLDADSDLRESNDHPASSPLCGWVVPNNLDNDILIYDADGQHLGIIDFTGIWRPAPGNAAAPAGPGLIPNAHLARVARWITANGSDSFMQTLLDTFDSSLSRIDPKDYSVQNAAALLVGRPIAVARAFMNLSLQGPPAQDQSQQMLNQRIAGGGNADHGFGAIEFPIRLGEYGQLNDGLVGYFRADEDRDGAHGTLYAPQSAASSHPAIQTYDPKTKAPLTIRHSFDAPPQNLTLLLDPRCPVHATTGILPTKAIRIPQDQFMPSLRALEMVFAAMPILTPPSGMQLPLPRIAGRTWSWLAIEDGLWHEQSGRATVTLADLRHALPGRMQITSGNVARLLDGDDATTGPNVFAAADLMWRALLEQAWITETQPGLGLLKGPAAPDSPPLGYGFGTAATQMLLSKIAKGLQPAQQTAVFQDRIVAREGWLRLVPTKDSNT